MGRVPGEEQTPTFCVTSWVLDHKLHKRGRDYTKTFPEYILQGLDAVSFIFNETQMVFWCTSYKLLRGTIVNRTK